MKMGKKHGNYPYNVRESEKKILDLHQKLMGSILHTSLV